MEYTLESMSLKLYGRRHEVEHDFTFTGEGIDILHDSRLGQDFWETMQAGTDYECKEIHMGNVTMGFDLND
jgi:hypothetical protein